MGDYLHVRVLHCTGTHIQYSTCAINTPDACPYTVRTNILGKWIQLTCSVYRNNVNTMPWSSWNVTNIQSKYFEMSN